MKPFKLAAACGLFCVLTGAAIAAEKPVGTIPVRDDAAKEGLASESRFSYTYGEVAYFHADIKEGDTNGDDLGEDGFGIAGSFLLIPNLFVVGSYQMAETDELTGIGEPLETTRFDLGAGYRHGLTSSLDLVGTVRVVQAKAEVSGVGDDDDTGFELAAGARFLPMDQLEVAGNISYLDLFDDGDARLNVSGLYHIIPLISVGVNLSFGDKYGEQTTAYGATVRFNF